MTISARTLRRILLAIGLVLIAVIAGFLGYARYRAHQYLANLPRKLGVNIKQETNGFTYSQSVGGRTIFTVHASKEVQRTNGRITLHDVGITLYGRTPGSSDRIHGSDFEYDPASGVLTAQGEVYLDLEAPANAAPAGSNTATNGRTVHVKTSGLVFVEKQRTANTDQPIEFSAGGLSGQAIGASYDSVAGTLILKRSVAMKGIRGGRPLALTASHAEIDRNANLVRLTSASVSESVGTGQQRLQAHQAVIAITPSGAPTSLDAQGEVLLTQSDGAAISGDRLRVDFNNSESGAATPRQARLEGNVRFRQAKAGQTREAHAKDLQVVFSSAGQPARANLSGGVVAEERAGSVSRSLRASSLQLFFQPDAAGDVVLQQAEMSGDATTPGHLVLTSPQAKTGFQASTEISAAHLSGQFAAASKPVSLQYLQGTGQTQIRQTVVDKSGQRISEEKSNGNSLRVSFMRGRDGQAMLHETKQQGHVSAVRQVAASLADGRAVAAQTEHARADTAQFDAMTNRTLLLGSVTIADSTGQLSADQVSIDRRTASSAASGSVRVTYSPSGEKSEPLHITAARAESNQARGTASFFGSGSPAEKGTPTARLWQGGSQLQAAQIDFDRPARKVTAHGSQDEVHAVLAGSSEHLKSGLTRVSSQKLVYSDIAHEVQLTGQVKVVSQQGSLASGAATIQLAEPSKSGPPTPLGAEGLMGGKVERIEADGGVTLDQPDRRAVGERLVYTAHDQTYILTGTKSTPPRLTDEQRGTVSGTALQFHAGDDSVEILSGAGQRVEGSAQLSKSPKGKR